MSDLAALDDSLSDLLQTDAQLAAGAEEQLRMVREELQNVRAQLTAANARATGLELALALKTVEGIQLRKGLHTARQAADPNIVQVRQLLLDPAVHREFRKMRTDADAKAHEAKLLRQELQAVSFSQDSKTGRMLMAKCRTLQEENEEYGRELAEGKVHALERAAALARGFGDDIRRQYATLETHAHALDRENEELQGQLFLARRQMKQTTADGSGPGGGGGGRQLSHNSRNPEPHYHAGYKRPHSHVDNQDSWDGRNDRRRRL